jgi:hypothetical protein
LDKLQTDNDALLDFMEEAEEYKSNTERALAELRAQCQRLEDEKIIAIEQEKKKVDDCLRESEKKERMWKRREQENEQAMTQNINSLKSQIEKYKALDIQLNNKVEENKELKEQVSEMQDKIYQSKEASDRSINELSNLY